MAGSPGRSSATARSSAAPAAPASSPPTATTASRPTWRRSAPAPSTSATPASWSSRAGPTTSAARCARSGATRRRCCSSPSAASRARGWCSSGRCRPTDRVGHQPDQARLRSLARGLGVRFVNPQRWVGPRRVALRRLRPPDLRRAPDPRAPAGRGPQAARGLTTARGGAPAYARGVDACCRARGDRDAAPRRRLGCAGGRTGASRPARSARLRPPPFRAPPPVPHRG